MPSLRQWAAAIAVLAALFGCKSRPSGPIAAPPFELTDLSGKTVTLESLKGHPVMLDFWATWCGPCQMSIPLVQRFYQQHKKEGLRVIGMNVDGERDGVYSFVKQFHMTYPVLYAAGTSTPDDFQVDGVPTFIFIDANGRIVRRFDGFHFDMAEAWEQEFQRLKTPIPRP